MAAERSITCFSIKCQENPYNGRHSIYWSFLVKTASQRRPSGISLTDFIIYLFFQFALKKIRFLKVFLQWHSISCNNQLFRLSFLGHLRHENKLLCALGCMQVTLFTRGKAPITQQLPGEADSDYAEFSSKVYLSIREI